MSTQIAYDKRNDDGFSLLAVLVSLFIAMIILASVFGMLYTGQKSFDRESQVSDMTRISRSGIQRISQDLSLAGYNSPPTLAILWNDGNGVTPDELTIVYGDPIVPVSEPLQCAKSGEQTKKKSNKSRRGRSINGKSRKGGGPCNTIERSSVLYIDPDTLNPYTPDPTQAYQEGMMLLAIETDDCNGDGQIGLVPFVLTQPPKMTNAGGSPTLQLNLNPGKKGHGKSKKGINPPGGFNGQVYPDCAVIGLFRVIQYRVSPLPPTPHPMLERLDWGIDEDWIPIANNIENLQVQYTLGSSDNFFDEPRAAPDPNDPATWITRVRVSVTGRSDSANLHGSTAGVFPGDDIYIRPTFTTSVTLRNQLISVQAFDSNQYN